MSFCIRSSRCGGVSPSSPSGRSIDLAPRERICSRASGLMSNPSTLAPNRRAIAIACNPATPAPRTTTLAGGIVPAAVIKRGNSFGILSAAIRTA